MQQQQHRVNNERAAKRWKQGETHWITYGYLITITVSAREKKVEKKAINCFVCFSVKWMAFFVIARYYCLSTYLYTCFGSFENVGVPEGFALRSRGCSAVTSTGLDDGFAAVGLMADVDSDVGLACIWRNGL